MNNRVEDCLIYLLKCVLNYRLPDYSALAVPMSDLYHLAKRHSVERMAFEAVKLIGAETIGQGNSRELRKNPNWNDEIFKKWQERCLVLETQSTIQQEECQQIIQKFKDREIKVLPLKGCIIKGMYPDPAYRQMGDIDLLIPGKMSELARTIMEEMGYETEFFDERNNHDVYSKRPLMHVELHRELFEQNNIFYSCYKNVWESLKPVDKDSNEYMFSWEDFYLYMLAHFAKHYYDKGSGIRSVMDIYVFRKKYGDKLDRKYIAGELNRLGLTEFCHKVEKLAEEWFSDETQGKMQRDDNMEAVIFNSGVYGTYEQAMRNRLGNLMTKKTSLKMAKLKYMFSQVFVNYEGMLLGYPILKKYPFLLPGCWIFRIFKVLLVKRDKVKKDWNTLKKIKE